MLNEEEDKGRRSKSPVFSKFWEKHPETNHFFDKDKKKKTTEAKKDCEDLRYKSKFSVILE